MPAPEPFDLTVLKALTTSLEGITPANGFFHDLTGAVFRGRMLYTETDPLPMLSINQPPVQPEEVRAPEGTAAKMTRQEVLIQGFVSDDYTNPTDPAFLLLGEVRARLSWERRRDEGFNVLGLGSKVQIQIGQGVVRSPDAEISDVAFFWLPVTLEYAEVLLA